MHRHDLLREAGASFCKLDHANQFIHKIHDPTWLIHGAMCRCLLQSTVDTKCMRLSFLMKVNNLQRRKQKAMSVCVIMLSPTKRSKAECSVGMHKEHIPHCKLPG